MTWIQARRLLPARERQRRIGVRAGGKHKIWCYHYHGQGKPIYLCQHDSKTARQRGAGRTKKMKKGGPSSSFSLSLRWGSCAIGQRGHNSRTLEWGM